MSLNLDSSVLPRKNVCSNGTRTPIDGNDSNDHLDKDDCVDSNRTSPYAALHPHWELDDLDGQYSKETVTKKMIQNGDTSSDGCNNNNGMAPRRKHGWVQSSLIRQDSFTAETNGMCCLEIVI